MRSVWLYFRKAVPSFRQYSWLTRIKWRRFWLPKPIQIISPYPVFYSIFYRFVCDSSCFHSRAVICIAIGSSRAFVRKNESTYDNTISSVYRCVFTLIHKCFRYFLSYSAFYQHFYFALFVAFFWYRLLDYTTFRHINTCTCSIFHNWYSQVLSFLTYSFRISFFSLISFKIICDSSFCFSSSKSYFFLISKLFFHRFNDSFSFLFVSIWFIILCPCSISIHPSENTYLKTDNKRENDFIKWWFCIFHVYILEIKLFVFMYCSFIDE